MRMVYTNAPSGVFEDAVGRLIARFEEWAAAHGREVRSFPVRTALDWRWGEGDGQLGRWTAADLASLLGEWMPRTAAFDAADVPHVLPALDAFVDFLTDEGLADPRSDDPAELHRELVTLGKPFAAAMADESRYGMAKFWAAQMRRRGIDPGDEEQAAKFAADLEAGVLTIDQAAAERALEVHVASLRGRLVRLTAMRAAALPDADELAEAAAHVPLFRQWRALCDYLGEDGRRLTKRGNVSLADARELVVLLETGEVVSNGDGRTRRTGSSTELHRLTLIVEWARTVKLVRTVRGRLVPVKKNQPLLADPLSLFDAAFGAFLGMGEWICRHGDWGGSLLYRAFDQALQPMLGALYHHEGELKVEALLEIVWARLGQIFVLDMDTVPTQLRFWRELVERDFRHVVEALDLLGAARRDGDLILLTGLGLRGVHAAVTKVGIRAPLASDLAREPLEVVVNEAANGSPERASRLLGTWWARRPSGEVLVELEALVRRTDDVQHRIVCFDALADLGSDGFAVLRRLATEREFAPYPKLSLTRVGVMRDAALSPQEHATLLLDSLLHSALAGPEELIGLMTEVVAPDLPLRMVAVLAASHRRGASQALAMIARHHPDPEIREAARHGLMT